MLPFDFTSLVRTFDTSTAANVTFLRWGGVSQVIAGQVIDSGFVPLVLSPQWDFVPRVPKDQLQRLKDGDRQRAGCLVWSIAVDAAGSYNTLRSIEQSPAGTRADRIVDNDTGRVYIVTEAWQYGRQSMISGAIGLLIDGESSME